jgi:hypothetical protein
MQQYNREYLAQVVWEPMRPLEGDRRPLMYGGVISPRLPLARTNRSNAGNTRAHVGRLPAVRTGRRGQTTRPLRARPPMERPLVWGHDDDGRGRVISGRPIYRIKGGRNTDLRSPRQLGRQRGFNPR